MPKTQWTLPATTDPRIAPIIIYRLKVFLCFSTLDCCEQESVSRYIFCLTLRGDSTTQDTHIELLTVVRWHSHLSWQRLLYSEYGWWTTPSPPTTTSISSTIPSKGYSHSLLTSVCFPIRPPQAPHGPSS